MKKSSFSAFLALCLLWILLFTGLLFAPKETHSLSERRPLALFPALTLPSFLSTDYPKDLETYLQDHFPLRESLRTLKARFRRDALFQMEVEGVFLGEGHAARRLPPWKPSDLDPFLRHIHRLVDMDLRDSAGRIHVAIIPDKSVYLQGAGLFAPDPRQLERLLKEALPDLSFIDLQGDLSLDAFYSTDPHWRQEALLPVAARLLQALTGNAQLPSYGTEVSPHPFHGAYYGQSALPLPPDTLTLLTHPSLDGLTVYLPFTKTWTPLYDRPRLLGRDPYDVFLSGASPLQILENPKSSTDRELLLFRDSFGSPLAPLLLDTYRTITLIDTRYIKSTLLSDYVDFHGQDVLFLYSTSLLLQGSSLR